MGVSPAEVRHLARLAHLRLEEAEVEEITLQLGAVLDHIEQLRGVALPDASSGEWRPGDALRPDHPRPDEPMRRLRMETPRWRDGFLVVPRLAALDEEVVPGAS